MRSIRSAAASLSACASLALAAPSQGAVMSFTSDASFVAFQNSGGFTKTFGGNVRWGNAASNGDWERAIVDASDTPIGTPAQNAWSLSNVHDVTFTFDASLNQATLDLSGIGSITRAVPASPEVLFARIRDSAGTASELKDIQIDLAFNGAGIDYSLSQLTGDANAEYWGISDTNLKFGFSLTAKVLFAGPQTAGSDPMYQFKVGVPSPGAAAVLAIASSMAARRKR
jgi:hypothetical protein